MNYILRVLCTPSCWIRNSRTSKPLTEFILKSLADGHKPERFGDFYVKLNGKMLWVQNYPYAYGTLGNLNDVMPSRKAVFALADAVERADLECDQS